MNFIKILFFHLLTQKWFKSLVWATLITFVIYFRKSFLSMFDEREWSTWFLLLGVMYVRFFVLELFKGRHYNPSLSITEDDFSKNKVGSIVSESNKGGQEIHFHITWNFSSELLVAPIIHLKNCELNDPNNWLIDSKIYTHNTSEGHANIKLTFLFQGTYPPEESTSFDKLIKEITLVANSNVYKKKSIRGRLLNFFSVWLPKNIKWLC